MVRNGDRDALLKLSNRRAILSKGPLHHPPNNLHRRLGKLETLATTLSLIKVDERLRAYLRNLYMLER